MANLDLTRLMTNCRVHLPGALDSAIQSEIFNVLNDFCQVTNIWQEKITFGVTAGDPSYLNLPRLGMATTYYIEQSSVSSINRLLGVVDDNNIPVAAVMATPGEIQLAVSPSNTTTYTATVALTVDDPVAASGSNAGFPEFPVWILNKYSIGLLGGVVARLMLQPAKPYSNPALMKIHYAEYAKARGSAKAEALHQNVNNGQTWNFPQAFATTRRQ